MRKRGTAPNYPVSAAVRSGACKWGNSALSPVSEATDDEKRSSVPQSSVAATEFEFVRADIQRTPARTPAWQAGGPLYGNRRGARRNGGVVIQWRVRPAEPADLDAIAAIQAASPEAALWPPGDYLQYDARVAVRERRVAGFLVTRRTAEGEAEVLNLAVAREFRRQGVGRALMSAFLEGFRGDVFLEVRSSNSYARGFYKSLGFQELTLRKDYYHTPPEAAIVMKFHSC